MRPRGGVAAKLRRRGMKWIRRAHLYAGLALVPFVALYGVTAVLFNHPTWWSTTEAITVPADAVDAAGRERLPSAEALAAALLAEVDDPRWQLDPAALPRFTGRSVLQAEHAGWSHSLVVEDADGAARLVSRPASARGDDASLRVAEGRELTTGRAALRSLETAASRLVGADVESSLRWRTRSSPRLEFGVVGDDGAFEASYDLGSGALRLTPVADAAPARSVRSFLLRLHTAHGYPADGGVRMVWAVLVDAMGLAMVAWAVSGLMMWWQMKNLRRVGLAALGVSAVGTAWLVAAQWQALG